MPKRPKKCPRDFSGTIADADIVSASLESLRPAYVPFWVTKSKIKI